MHAFTMTHADTTTAAADPAAYEPASPLMLDAAAAACRGELTDAVRRTGPVRREAAAAAIPPLEAALLARHATADRRPTRERVLDRVVDGLLAELRR
jgi:hypothetical protein